MIERYLFENIEVLVNIYYNIKNKGTYEKDYLELRLDEDNVALLCRVCNL